MGVLLGCWFNVFCSYIILQGAQEQETPPTSKGHPPSKPGLRRSILPGASSTPVVNFRFSRVCAPHSKKNQDVPKKHIAHPELKLNFQSRPYRRNAPTGCSEGTSGVWQGDKGHCDHSTKGFERGTEMAKNEACGPIYLRTTLKWHA